jgi:CRISPR-associated endonuclease/helicase Cas3
MRNEKAEFYAHTNGSSDPKDWQPLQEHLLNVANLAKQFAQEAKPDDEKFAQAAYLSGLLHDLGKYRKKFQQMLRDTAKGKPKAKVLHSKYGATIAKRNRWYDVGLSILGHHSGLPSLTAIRSQLIDDDEKLAEYLLNTAESDWPTRGLLSGSYEISKQDNLKQEFLIRMLFSCLIDADRLDSSGTKNIIKKAEFGKAYEKLTGFISNLSANKSDSKIKRIRSTILEKCVEVSISSKKLFSLTVPTGTGKTLSSMAFALKRASTLKNIDRIIVVIPFLSIIEQNAGIYKNALGNEWILEHHSVTFNSDMDENDVFQNIATENWDFPIIATTSVRFFESIFSNRPTDLRRLHNIANSVIILDEVQTLPKIYLGAFLSIIKILTDSYNTTFLFCTATQPAFEKSKENKHDIRWSKGTITPVINKQEQMELFAELQRVKEPVWPAETKTGWDELTKRMLEYNQALCVVNTKRHCYEIYSKLKTTAKEKKNIYHLSARMYPQHRLEKIEKIKNILRQKEDCYVISTQLIEAGVDIDFPVVFRAMAPFDSIIQAAGRCDREGHLTDKEGKPAGQLFIFEPDDKSSPYQNATDITRNMAGYLPLSIHTPEHVRLYFDNLYSGDQDPNDILALMKRFDYPEVAARFNMIDDTTTPILIRHDKKAAAIIEKVIRSRIISIVDFRRLQRYQIGLYPYEFEKAKETGSIVELWPDSNIWMNAEKRYSSEYGFFIKEPDVEEYIF